FGAREATRIVLAGDQPALAIARQPVRVVRRLAKHAGAPGRLVPAQDAIVGDIAPEKGARVAEPGRAFAPARPGVEPLDACLRNAVAREARIEVLHPRVRIARTLLPGGEGRPGQGRRCGCAQACEHGASVDLHSVPPKSDFARASQPPSAPCVLT